MNIHRVLSGSPERRVELVAAGIFVLVWFAMDVHQYGDFLWQKWHPTCTLSVPLGEHSFDVQGHIAPASGVIW